ncbi:MAG TPA: DNA topoisomerase IB [Methylomirabilota bacterium]|nr:DNA topoisomerase IB [Methylomirabilota bacterium]
MTDRTEAAHAASLHYVSDATPGIRRRRAGRHFVYVGPDGRPIRDLDRRRRIKALTIPPAWTDVWISPNPRGHIQATGRDARGRKQYRYHPRWRVVRDDTKYGRLVGFGRALPRIRAAVERDLARPGLPREKVVATVVRLLETTAIRVGNAEYARNNGSFGLTTMRDRHVGVSGSTLRFQFRGKGGKLQQVDVSDRRLARIVRRCQDLPGQELFQYLDEDGLPQRIGSGDVNAYLRAVGGEEFTAKDFRTWTGTVLAVLALQEFRSFDSTVQAKRNVVRAIESVARRLGNTPTICRKCYVHPAVVDAYLEGGPAEALQRRVERDLARSLRGLRPEEAAVLALLRSRLARQAAGLKKAA